MIYKEIILTFQEGRWAGPRSGVGLSHVLTKSQNFKRQPDLTGLTKVFL